MSTTTLRLSDLKRCFQGVVPSIITTSDAQRIPNVTFISHVYFVDDRHVALSCQFFNKTRRNLDENPLACVEVWEPITLQAYRLRLKFARSEKSGPLFDTMSLRIDAIASHTGMTGVFKLIAADICEVQAIEVVEGLLTDLPPDVVTDNSISIDGMRTEVRGLQCISERINRAPDLELLLHVVLEALEDYFHFSHTSVLLFDEPNQKLVTLASRGYGQSGVGAEVALGQGIIGTVARSRQVLRLTNFEAELRYGRAIRRETAEHRGAMREMEVPLPGLPDAQSVLAIPLAIGDRLIGVLSAEDRDPMRFGEWHEAYLEIVGNQIALGIDRMLARGDEASEAAHAHAPATQPLPAPPVPRPATPSSTGSARRRLTYYANDDAIFVDDEYLIRNVAAKILWKVLRELQRTGRTEFSNRELRVDASLGLPPVKDNLESRLLLLRHRLKDKLPELQMVPSGRGRFSLRSQINFELIER